MRGVVACAPAACVPTTTLRGPAPAGPRASDRFRTAAAYQGVRRRGGGRREAPDPRTSRTTGSASAACGPTRPLVLDVVRPVRAVGGGAPAHGRGRRRAGRRTAARRRPERAWRSSRGARRRSTARCDRRARDRGGVADARRRSTASSGRGRWRARGRVVIAPGLERSAAEALTAWLSRSTRPSAGRGGAARGCPRTLGERPPGSALRTDRRLADALLDRLAETVVVVRTATTVRLATHASTLAGRDEDVARLVAAISGAHERDPADREGAGRRRLRPST